MRTPLPQPHNPVERFVRCFPTVAEAAGAAGVTTEMLRQFRKRGYVNTRDRALAMARGCRNKVSAADLLAVGGKGPSP